jgi:hypothetical protein
MIVDDGDSRAVVAAILKGAETFDKNGVGFLVADVSDDSAHGEILWKKAVSSKGES